MLFTINLVKLNLDQHRFHNYILFQVEGVYSSILQESRKATKKKHEWAGKGSMSDHRQGQRLVSLSP